MGQVESLKFKGKYPMKMERKWLGYDSQRERDAYENRIYLYIGRIRLDITDMNPLDVDRTVRILELSNITGENHG